MNSSESIEKYALSIKNSFSEQHFFNDILKTCYEKKLLDDRILKRISYERLETLKVQLKYYTKDNSSSVMVEAAESILQGIDYTIGIYLKTLNNMDSIVKELKNRSLLDMLKMGHSLIKKKIAEGKKLLEKIQKNKLKVNNYSYNDTIDYGIPLFFKEYEDFFAAHETPGSIDYQLYMDNMDYKGIEYINNYLYTLNLENEFCSHFDIYEINELLKGYDKKCELLLVNIFELVFINSLGLIICGKSLERLNINSIDRKYIGNKLCKLSLRELKEVLLNCTNKCCEVLDIKNQSLVNYIRISVSQITLLINKSIKLNKLEKVFISFNESADNEIIEYIDGKKLSDSSFRKLSEKIRECSSVEDKIRLIKNNIKSLEDLIDILEAECLFKEEFIKLFRNLSQMEIVLLSRHISDLSLDNEYEREWYQEFNKYILSLSEKEQSEVKEFEKRIQF